MVDKISHHEDIVMMAVCFDDESTVENGNFRSLFHDRVETGINLLREYLESSNKCHIYFKGIVKSID